MVMKNRVQGPGKPAFERRRGPRVRLSAPAQLSRAEAGSPDSVASVAARAVDVSTAGMYLLADPEARIAPGEIFMVSMSIPWEFRRAFPFSLVEGACRVVRVDAVSAFDGGKQGLALAFCGSNVTMLGAALLPR